MTDNEQHDKDELTSIEYVNPFTEIMKKITRSPLPFLERHQLGKEIEATLVKWIESEVPTKVQVKAVTDLVQSTRRYIVEDEDYIAHLKALETLTQGFILDGKKHRASPRKVSVSPDEENRLTGIAAVRYMSSRTHHGKPVSIDCYRSCFRLLIGDFSPRDTMMMSMLLANEKLDVGRSTSGFMFSSDDVHITKPIMEFILSHVIDSTIINWTPQILADLFDMRDAKALMAAALDSMYPDGYPYVRACVNDKCEYVTGSTASELPMIRFISTIVPDISMISPMHARFVGSDYQRSTVAQVKSMQEKVSPTYLTPALNEGDTVYQLEIEAPKFTAYGIASSAWLKEVEIAVSTTLGITSTSNMDHDLRIKRLVNLNKTLEDLSLERNSSWVKAIIVTETDGDPMRISGDELLGNLEIMNADYELAEVAERAIEEFKFKTTISHVGIPNYLCPVTECSTSQLPEDSQFMGLIPINIMACFLDIMGWKTLEKSLQKVALEMAKQES